MTERSLHPGGTRKGISMTTFLALDLRIMSGALRGLGIILAVGTLGLAAGNVDFFMPFVTILAVMGVMNLFASIEAGGLTRLFGSLPGTRADAMRAHYLFVLVCAAISFVPWLLGLLVHLAVPRWGVEAGELIGWLTPLGGVLIALAVLIPCIVKVGIRPSPADRDGGGDGHCRHLPGARQDRGRAALRAWRSVVAAGPLRARAGCAGRLAAHIDAHLPAPGPLTPPRHRPVSTTTRTRPRSPTIR